MLQSLSREWACLLLASVVVAASGCSLIDQISRDAIQARQALKGWPATGELSRRWVQALLAGSA